MKLLTGAMVGVTAVGVTAVISGFQPSSFWTTPAASVSTASQASTASPTPARGAGLKRSPAAKAVRVALGTAEAEILGLQPQQLRTALKGATLATLAGQKGISAAQFEAQLVARVTPLLQTDVSSGTLTQGQEQKLLTRLGKLQAPPNWNRTHPASGKRLQPASPPATAA